VSERTPATAALLDVFFGEGADPPASLAPWIERLEAGVPTVLPRSEDDGAVLYGIAPDAAESRGLAEELVAAIGPTWTDFDGSSTPLDPENAVERGLIEWTREVDAGPVLVLRLAKVDRPAVWDSMERMRRLWESRPRRDHDDLLAVALPDLLRDTELALRAPDLDEAERLIAALTARGELSSQNLLFLRLRLEGAAERWYEILGHPRLEDVLNARRPSAVTAMLFEAAATILEAPRAATDPEEALDRYRRRVVPLFAPLLRSSPDLTSPEALEIRLLAIVDGGGTRESIDAILAAADPTDRPWFDSLAALTTPPPASPAHTPSSSGEPDDPTAAARAALYAGDFREVLALLDGTASAEAIDLMARAAAGVGSLDAARVVATAHARLSAAEVTALETVPGLAATLDEVLARGRGSEDVSTWVAWFERLGGEEEFDAALDVAERGALEWPAGEPADAAAADALARAVVDAPVRVSTTVERAMPFLLRYLDRRSSQDDLAIPVYLAVLERIAYGSSRTGAMRETVISVLPELLAGIPQAGAYDELVALLEFIWADLRSAAVLGWLADALALLLYFPCPRPEARLRLLRKAIADAATLPEVDFVVRNLLRELAGNPILDGALDDEVASMLPESEVAVEEDFDPGSLTVGIYSLSPASSQRARETLGKLYPSLTIELNAELDGSAKMRGLAERADVMAVVIASAKHAATDAIRAACPPRNLLEVGTAGSTGLIQAIRGRLEDLAVD